MGNPEVINTSFNKAVANLIPKKIMSDFDVIVIGGGPAGMSAACWSAELNLSVLLIESGKEVGGQLLWTFNPIKNHLGIEAENGSQMRDVFERQMENWNFEIMLETEVLSIDFDTKTLTTETSKAITYNSLVIATGISRRKLNVIGEDKFKGNGILESGKRDSEKVRGKSVCVIGGGDAALENALILAETAKKVTLIYRGEKFRGRESFLDQISQNPKIEVLKNTIVLEIIGEDTIEGLMLKNDKEFIISTDSIIIRIGVEPNTKLFAKSDVLDEAKYVRVDHNCETKIKNVFAVGDVANALSPTISSAVGMGSTAAKVIRSRIES
jgi:thioredoxin reductase (NADPH)